MLFRTEVTIPEAERKFDHSTPLLSLGSCFADEIGRLLEEHLFACCANPLGTVFHPLAICRILERALANRPFEPSEFFLFQELWRHNLVHSSLASIDLQESVQNANGALQSIRAALQQGAVLFLTFGSAWTYELAGSRELVAHNHRRPQSDFTKRLADPIEISAQLSDTLAQLFDHRPDLQVCLTVSPVRHVKEGLRENNLSKASLQLAAHRLIETFPQISYFPAFEILNDELRDYRYFANDLAHPSSSAIDYIWQRFCKCFLESDTQRLVSEISRVNTTLSHRTLHPGTQAHQRFKAKLRQQIDDLGRRDLPTEALLRKWRSLP